VAHDPSARYAGTSPARFHAGEEGLCRNQLRWISPQDRRRQPWRQSPSDAEPSLGDLLGAVVVVAHACLRPIDKILIEQRCVQEIPGEFVGFHQLVLQEYIDDLGVQRGLGSENASQLAFLVCSIVKAGSSDRVRRLADQARKSYGPSKAVAR
jgi:hypothetical protein